MKQQRTADETAAGSQNAGDDTTAELRQRWPGTYSARYRDQPEAKPIYSRQPQGNLFGELPLGASPIKWGSPDDPWNGAEFLAMGSGRTIVVTRDPAEDSPTDDDTAEEMGAALAAEFKMKRDPDHRDRWQTASGSYTNKGVARRASRIMQEVAKRNYDKAAKA